MYSELKNFQETESKDVLKVMKKEFNTSPRISTFLLIKMPTNMFI